MRKTIIILGVHIDRLTQAQALEKLTGKQVKEKLIWAARLAEIVEV